MGGLIRFLNSSIGAKVVMAVTGLALAGFVVGHLAGNLLVFAGQDALNSYAEWLKTNPLFTWTARIGILVMFVLHVRTGIVLSSANKAARPARYAHEATVQATYASRSMFLTGLLVLTYILLHLAHFTFGFVGQEGYALTETIVRDGVEVTRHDVYGMVLAGFGNTAFVVVYIAAMVVLGLHLSHGLQSLFQTLGLRHASYTPLIEKVGVALAWILAAGYIAIPVLVRAGVVA